MPAALGTVKMRGSAREGELGSWSSAARVDSPGSSLSPKPVGRVSPWRLPRYVRGGEKTRAVLCLLERIVTTTTFQENRDLPK